MTTKSFLASFSLLMFAVSFVVQPVIALTPTPTPSLRDSVKDKVAAELSQIKQGVGKKGFIGSITAKSDATLTVTNLKNETRTVMVTTDTVIKLANSKDGTLTDIKTNDFVIAMGDVDSQNTMTAKRMLIVATPPTDKRISFQGAVTKSTSTSFTVKTSKGTTMDIKVSAGTKYNEKYKLSDLAENSNVVVIALTGGTSSAPTYTALKVFLIK